jgi:hypothetical protein
MGMMLRRDGIVVALPFVVVDVLSVLVALAVEPDGASSATVAGVVNGTGVEVEVDVEHAGVALPRQASSERGKLEVARTLPEIPVIPFAELSLLNCLRCRYTPRGILERSSGSSMRT